MRTLDVLTEKLGRALKSNNEIAINAAAENICAHGIRARRDLDHLVHLFQQGEKPHLVLDFLLSPASSALTSLAMAACVARFAQQINRLPDFYSAVTRFITSGGYARFNQSETLGAITRDPAIRRSLRSLKFAGIADLSRADRLFSNAEILAPRIALDAEVCRFLFERSRAATESQIDWEKRVQSAFAVEHLCKDAAISDLDLDGLLDPTATQLVLQHFDANRGALVVISHCGFSRPRTNFFRSNVDNVAMMATTIPNPKRQQSNRIPINLDARAALFGGLKALLDNKIVFLTPDGQQGSHNTSISVLGKETSIGDGAAFLAYESKCPTFWFDITRSEDRFIPAVTPGPVRETTESESDFRTRFGGFYEAMLNNFFSGDPRNLVFMPRWKKVFSSDAETD